MKRIKEKKRKRKRKGRMATGERRTRKPANPRTDPRNPKLIHSGAVVEWKNGKILLPTTSSRQGAREV